MDETHEPNVSGINLSSMNIAINNLDQYENEDPFNSLGSSILEERKNDSSRAFIMHLNINSRQNKFEEFKLLNSSLNAQVVVIYETNFKFKFMDKRFHVSTISENNGMKSKKLSTYIQTIKETECKNEDLV